MQRVVNYAVFPFPQPVQPTDRLAVTGAEVWSFSRLKDVGVYVMPEDNGKYTLTDSRGCNGYLWPCLQ